MSNQCSDSSPQTEAGDSRTYVVCVVAAIRPKNYENFYIAVNGSWEEAVKMKTIVATKGFVSNGERVFPDQIESITLKVHNAK